MRIIDDFVLRHVLDGHYATFRLSMMAMLAEVRLPRKLHVHDPVALSDELAHAEQVAHQGLKIVRAARRHDLAACVAHGAGSSVVTKVTARP
ncbi:MAG: hypothetical protein ACYCTW_02795 [Sulfuricella sp.]